MCIDTPEIHNMLSAKHLRKEHNTKKYVLCVHTSLNSLVCKLRAYDLSTLAVNIDVMSL